MCIMLKKTIVITVLLSVFSTTFVLGQKKYSDTIRLQMPNKTTIEYAMHYRRDKPRRYNDKKLEEQKEFENSLRSFLKRWEVLGITNLKEKKPLFIKDSGTKIEISERNLTTKVLFPEDTKLVLTIKGKHKLRISQSVSDLYIYFDSFNQLEELLDYDIEKILKSSDKKLFIAASDKKNKRTPLQAWLSVDKSDNVGLTYQKFVQKKRKHPDYLYFGISPNIENINGKWLAGCSIDLAYVLNANTRFGISYEGMYNFSETQETNISEWLDVSVAASTRTMGGIGWIGISLGYLVNHKGGFFDNHKFRIGAPFSISENITVSPEIYFKDFFKESKDGNEYLGVKVSFHLF